MTMENPEWMKMYILLKVVITPYKVRTEIFFVLERRWVSLWGWFFSAFTPLWIRKWRFVQWQVFVIFMCLTGFILFILTSTWGKWSNLTNIFQMGWFNHQPGVVSWETFFAKPLVWCKPWSLPIVPQAPTHFRLYALSQGKQRTTDPALLFVPGHGGSGVPRKSHLLLLGVYWGDASSSASLKKRKQIAVSTVFILFWSFCFLSIKLLNTTRFLV